MRALRFIAVAFALLSCGGDPAGPSRPEIAGSYQLTTLTFDPQGSLPGVDILARLEGAVPRLILAPGGEAQLVFEDPVTGLIETTNGTYSTPQSAVRMDLGTDAAFRSVLLSRRMTFTVDDPAVTLQFDGEAPDGVVRERLVQLVPEYAGEQLLDPVPGRLVVEFTRSP